MSKFEIIFYETPSGEYPVKIFLKSIDNKKLYAKILHDIDLLATALS